MIACLTPVCAAIELSLLALLWKKFNNRKLLLAAFVLGLVLLLVV